MIVGCYTLDLCCDHPKHKPTKSGGPTIYGTCEPAQFTGPTAGACRKEARKSGWRLELDEGVAFCPVCAEALIARSWEDLYLGKNRPPVRILKPKDIKR
ncbi:hypothetical protein LCGC14_1533210 [marine sediment metagenome]|uniref:Uncharacterized protein n=1 Tax=marine sediment metagenome TaxID=412755 RepID=A0A0F9JG68_9ZZZZ